MGEPSDESSRHRSVAKNHVPDGEVSPNLPDTTAGTPSPVPPNSLSTHQPISNGGDDRASRSATTPGRKARSRSNGSENERIAAINRDDTFVHELAPDGSPSASPAEDAQAEGEKPSALDRGLDGGKEKPASSAGEKQPITTRAWNGSKRFWVHTKGAITYSYVNILLVFVPIGIAAKFANLSPDIVFAMNAIAIIPLAGLLTRATESVARRLGDTLGALLNVSFGNAVELIIL